MSAALIRGFSLSAAVGSAARRIDDKYKDARDYQNRYREDEPSDGVSEHSSPPPLELPGPAAGGSPGSRVDPVSRVHPITIHLTVPLVPHRYGTYHLSMPKKKP